MHALTQEILFLSFILSYLSFSLMTKGQREMFVFYTEDPERYIKVVQGL